MAKRRVEREAAGCGFVPAQHGHAGPALPEIEAAGLRIGRQRIAIRVGRGRGSPIQAASCDIQRDGGHRPEGSVDPARHDDVASSHGDVADRRDAARRIWDAGHESGQRREVGVQGIYMVRGRSVNEGEVTTEHNGRTHHDGRRTIRRLRVPVGNLLASGQVERAVSPGEVPITIDDTRHVHSDARSDDPGRVEGAELRRCQPSRRARPGDAV